MSKKPAALSHVDASGRARMVDVSAKAATSRQAVARGHIALSAAARKAVRGNTLKKGDALATARLAGVMAAKRTADLIPLCHPLQLTHVDVEIEADKNGYVITATVRTNGPTGVEMEALTAVSVTALTIYDMVKAVDQGMTIGSIHVTEKTGGKRDFRR
jgi:cyclic pyranopterin phosphate synthase